ncbi:hypothetical protein CAPTEDRAFT_19179 [Capitella teleta]|uniref:JmjC domain-containing protein n=1 Tax=Capitella teleta TaxID=283909 RepID=R7V3W0_CAPTE|nr:hypothetical protein CAPTEDRAFT_19179 [Capitella teleta]|eukprot:ELU10495.1 hypothetical protein CAPTEDRAFT_19179 [Capitella teleta]
MLFHSTKKILRSLFLFISLKNCICCDASAEDDGGWTTDPETRIAQPGPCNIEIRGDDLTQEEFLERYAHQAPLILRGVTDNKVFAWLSRKDNMLQEYGSKIIRLSSANTHSYSKVDVSLEKYVEEILGPQGLDSLGNETMIWFGDNNHTEWKKLFDSYLQPPYRLPGLTGAYSFGLAGPGTGVPFHFHGPGFAEVIYGRKRWFLYPPHQEPRFNPDKTTLHWLLDEYPNLHGSDMPYECTMGPGEVLYFPDHWWHGTLNIDTSVFISTFLG